MKGCWEQNLKLREAERLFEDQLTGPESITNIGGQITSSWVCIPVIWILKSQSPVPGSDSTRRVLHILSDVFVSSCLQTSFTPEQLMAKS